MTYSENGRVLRHGWRVVLLDGGSLLDTEILDIAAAEDDVLVHLVRGSYLFLGSSFATFRAE
jgi:hypothetical protein